MSPSPQFPEVTLCIPLYNAENTISRTLESLMSQDYPQLKIKVFDNHSTDKSREIVLEFIKKFPTIELHESDVNTGAEANFTKCIQAAEGDYTAIVHSDDLYESHFVSRSVAVLEASPETVAVFCGAQEIDSDEKITGSRFIPKELTQSAVSYLTHEELLKLVFLYGNFITCPSVVARTSAYKDKIKNWNGDQYKSSADLDVWLRLSKLGKIAAINAPLMKYRVAEASHSFRIAKKRISRHDLFLVLDQYKNLDDAEDIQFLEIKDQAIRSLNLIRSQAPIDHFPILDKDFKVFLVLKKMQHSKWHFKMGLSILGIYTAVCFFNLTKGSWLCKKKQ